MKRIKQLNQVQSYVIEHEGTYYSVILERLQNDVNGCPRYKAIITNLSTSQEPYYSNYLKEHKHLYLFNYVYTFTGSYCGDIEEAKNILKYALNNQE